MYLIKSTYWTKNNQVDTYYRDNENGYTTLIAEAGIYSEEQADKIVKSAPTRVKAIPITKVLITKGNKQCEEKHSEVLRHLEAEVRKAYAEITKLDHLKENLSDMQKCVTKKTK